MKLTKRVVDAATYTGSAQGAGWTRSVLWDDDLHGFGLRIYPSGRKVFVLSYRARGSKRLSTLGAYGVLTVDEARKKASRLLYAIGDGADPAVERREERREPTFTEFAQRYLAQHGPKKKPSSLATDKRLLSLHLLPRLGARKMRDLDRTDVTRVHHDLRETPVLANRVLALLSKMMNLAEAWGIRADSTNPVRHVDRYAERAKERYLSPSELARLGEALRDVEQEGSEHPSALLAIRLLALTGARRNEILTLTWDAVNVERAELVLADSKTGPKRIPLPTPALKLLQDAPRLAGNPYVCTGEREGGHFIGLQRPWDRIRRLAGLPDVRLHDLRHTHAATAVSAGLALPLVGKLLGHTHAATTQRYAHLRDDPVKAAAELVGGEIGAAMGVATHAHR
jgi:integrase